MATNGLVQTLKTMMAIPLAVVILLSIVNEAAAAPPDSTTLAPTLCYQYDYKSNYGYACAGVPSPGYDTVATKSECEEICNGMRSDEKSCLGFEFDSSTGANAAEGTCTFYASFTGRDTAGITYSCNVLTSRRLCTDTSKPTKTPTPKPTTDPTTSAPTPCYQYDYTSNNGYTCAGVPSPGYDTVATKSECEDICNGMRSDEKSCLGFEFDSSTGANAAEGTCTFYTSFTGRAVASTTYSCNALIGRRLCTSISVPTKAPTSMPSISPTLPPTKTPTAAINDAPTANPTSKPTSTPSKIPTSPPSVTPSTKPSKTPTTAPTATTTKTPTKEPTGPTTTPTMAPTQNTCTFMWADIAHASASFSHVVHSQVIPTETLVTGIYDTDFVMGASPPDPREVMFKDPRGDPFNIGLVFGGIAVDIDMSVRYLIAVDNSNFYINRVGGIVSSRQISASELDPHLGDAEPAFRAANGEQLEVMILDAYSRVLGWDENGADECSDSVTPHANCAGPWYTYTYVEICAKNSLATKTPTQVTSPTAFATSAPSASTPLIDVVFTNSSTPVSIKLAFENARDIWNGIITNTNQPVNLPAGATNASTGVLNCGANTDFPAGTTSLSGLTIFADIGAIDGVGEILGQAGPCAFSYNLGSDTVFGNSMSRIGVMKFDVEDLQSMVDNGSLERIVLHEMGHILGLGPGWEKFRVGKASQAANNPRYVGAHAVEGYKQVSGLSNDIPVANTGGSGTADAHWRESTFEDELMTGYATGPHTISIMTLKSLIDLGYVVDESKAEPYSISPAQTNDIKAKGDAPRAMLVDDILKFGEVGSLKPAV